MLALDDRSDFDFARGVVVFRGSVEGDADEPGPGHEREVVLPEFLAREIRRFLDEPGNVSRRGTVFALDQGNVRRKFYEVADRASLPRDHVNPRVIRNSRAVELLREGLPIQVLQSVLGHSTLALTQAYCSFREDDLRSIMEHHILRETKMKTSARNTFSGSVSAIRSGDLLAEVELTTQSGLKVVSVITNESLENLGIAEGKVLAAIVKAPWVILVSDEDLEKTSARNRFRGTITRINEGKIAAEVIGSLEDGTAMVALVTDESVKKLNLKVGDKIWFLFKAFSVILNAE